MPATRKRRLLPGGGRNSSASAACGCSTAVVARLAFLFRADPKAPVSVLLRPAMMPGSSRLILEAVEPGGPWRLFIGGARAAKMNMLGPYDAASDTLQLVFETVSLIRGMGMAVEIEGDYDRAMGTFRSCGVETPTIADMTGGE